MMKVCVYYELRREKGGLWGFRPDPTQTCIYSLRKSEKPEILDFRRRGIALSVNQKQRCRLGMQLMHS